MDIFPWNETFDTGIAEIDTQHRELVDLLNQLVRHLTEQADAPTIKAIIDQLRQYALVHFECEEAIWQSVMAGDPWVAEHHEEHERFVQDLQRLQAEEADHDFDEVILDVVGFLSHWLALHILESDKRLAYAVRACQTGTPVTEARREAERAMTGATRTAIQTVMTLYGHLTQRTVQLTREIAQRRRTEALLRQAKEEAVRATEAKSRFLAVMTHEIRSPMNGIMGLIELARRRATEPHQADQLARALGASRQLLGIVNDVLDFSKIEAGRLELTRNRFTLSEVADALAGVAQVQAQARGLTLALDLPDDIATRPLLGDALRLGQVLMNLTGNAIKFTEQGRVTVRLRLCETGPDRVRLDAAVQDTGIGIALSDQARLFGDFTQVGAAAEGQYGGTGLGLSISRGLVSAMGGEIGVDSTPGTGSTFHFSVPLAVSGDPG